MANSLIAIAHNQLARFARWCQNMHTHLIHYSLGPLHSPSQAASEPFHLFFSQYTLITNGRTERWLNSTGKNRPFIILVYNVYCTLSYASDLCLCICCKLMGSICNHSRVLIWKGSLLVSITWYHFQVYSCNTFQIHSLLTALARDVMQLPPSFHLFVLLTFDLSDLWF